MQVVVDSLLTQYVREGTGKTVIILHGWGDNSKSWLSFHKALAQTYDVVILDLPGFGDSQTPNTAWGINDYASFVGAFLKKLNIKPYAIIGHSNGCAIAIRGLSKKYLHAERLVLLDSAGIRNVYKGRKKALRIITKTGKLVTLPLPHKARKWLRQKVYKTIGSDMLVAERLQETFKRVVTDDIQADAATLELPTVLIYGENDLATPVQYGRMLHNLISHSTLEVIPGAEHFVHLEKPEIVLKLVRSFLK